MAQKLKQAQPGTDATESKFSDTVEKKYKILLRVMSWIVGISIATILILPEFNSALLDRITKVIFIIGFIDLLFFLVIEFISDNIKNIIQRFSHD